MSGEQKLVPEPEPENSSNKISPDAQRLADLIAEEEIDSEGSVTLKQNYINLMNQLEIDGVPKQDISVIGSQLIVEKKKQRLSSREIEFDNVSVGSWWYDVARKRGYTNPDFVRNTKDDLPTIPPTNFELENKQTISTIDSMIEYLKSEKQYLKYHSHDTKIPENIHKENIYTMNNAIRHANERFNKKLKIAPSHYSILFRNFMETMSSHLSVPFYLHVRDKETFTAKQAGKIIRANVKDIPYQYEPINQDEAEACNFSGVQCPGCKFWRTEVTLRIEAYKDENGILQSKGIRQVHCFKEDKDYDIPKAKIPADEISNAEW